MEGDAVSFGSIRFSVMRILSNDVTLLMTDVSQNIEAIVVVSLYCVKEVISPQ